MACGLAVVATAAPGIPDIFENGELSGGVVVPRNDVEAFASALGRLVDDDALCGELGRRARARAAEAFSLEVVGKRLKVFLSGPPKLVPLCP